VLGLYEFSIQLDINCPDSYRDGYSWILVKNQTLNMVLTLADINSEALQIGSDGVSLWEKKVGKNRKVIWSNWKFRGLVLCLDYEKIDATVA
jgi:hypothetical protein